MKNKRHENAPGEGGAINEIVKVCSSSKKKGVEHKIKKKLEGN
jgi:hypothetical protein